MNEKPLIGITMGDPSGIGPEISAKLFARDSAGALSRPVLYGDKAIMERALRDTGLEEKLTIRCIEKPEDGVFEPGILNLINLENPELKDIPVGTLHPACGDAAYRYVEAVIQDALAGNIDATVTNPLNKEALNLGGHHYSGHTEIYADLTGTDHYSMLLAHENVRVVHVSTHVSLREACDRVKKARVLECIEIADKALKSFGVPNPRIAVAGLNPHSGEGGLFGTEEIDEIIPAIEEAKDRGYNVDGPIPPDTLFSKANGGMYDVVVAMYHDQGHIPLKVLGFVYDQQAQKWKDVKGVNITLGLPIIRASVDHGTAFDQAGTGQASDTSLFNALEYAVQMAKNKGVQ